MNRVGILVLWTLGLTMLAAPAQAARYALATPGELRRINFLVGDVVARYRSASIDYQKHGPLDFLAHFGLGENDQRQIRSTYFKGLPLLPTLESENGGTLVLRTPRSAPLRIEIVSFDKSLIRINGEDFYYDESQDLMTLIAALEAQIGVTRPANLSFQFSLIRSAHADAKLVAFVLGGMVAGVLVKMLFNKFTKDKDGRQKDDRSASKSSATGGANPHVAGTPAAGSGGAEGGNDGPAKPPVVASNVPGITSDIDATVQNILAQNPSLPKYNKLALDGVLAAGNKCTYDLSQANANVGRVTSGYPTINFDALTATHCSGYTYPIFAYIAAQDQSTLAGEALAQIKGSAGTDGVGPYGYFNANGFGTAEFFKDAKIGHSFADMASAKPGDFLKILWSDSAEGVVGAGESGHSVIYLGSNQDNVCFASANQTGNLSGLQGCGIRCVPKTKIYRTMFSRIDQLEPLRRLDQNFRSTYLPTLVEHKVEGRTVPATAAPIEEAQGRLGIAI